ncbi:MerR family transcriptional regulator [Paenibacillus sp. PR3]|uniref:MerR family transcriptional regulator n=1 Tax=Paenibacillus terricola TaxID=2763503 RepID=A0ABR8MY48_9BACL|nr:MerR family transcriptional regulator [Paenibacillus terricola]
MRTIRYYEEQGIIKPARTTDANYRYYGTAEREKLGIIIFLRKIGFSLQHIKTTLAVYQRSTMLQIIDELNKKMELEMDI